MLHPPKVGKLIEALLGNAGVISQALRQKVEAHAARHGGAAREPAPLPRELETFVDKVALAAYKLTDDDFERLHAVGHDDDAIFELTLSAALGAALARLERGMAALHEKG